ncbi:dTDP-4-dehydrorhamnose 3,5-epimerase family protein [Priestia aryabhattai]|uniref:dTDP-4-dehydrorhamnose 3,5-epimerase family protein n=1 Tax=Priestia aryabhattai TaxID=412384 RepID=UPI00064FB67D|nr:dTDP-4-dehydrorhamnose 3,5-epimerase family protein [Priestia aryabhattai]KML22992.1 spore coat protein [Priestia aryabhattai]KMN99163.1 spore coat protein [Priestia aryabhattai]
MSIDGVILKKIIKHCDDRGFFAEILRDDDDLLTHFGQLSWSMSYPGVIKAFHYHKEQDDIWFFPSGNVQVVLHDLRENSITKGETNVHYMGEEDPNILFIPHGVAHGYRVLGEKSAIVIYCTTKSYNSIMPDEERIPWNDESIGFDWSTKHR